MFGLVNSPHAWLAAAVFYGLAGYMETPGTGGGGGAPAGGGAAPAGDAAATGADAAAGDAGGADDHGADAAARGDVDDRDDDHYPDHDDDVDALPEPNVRTRLRATQRYAQRVRPLTERLRDPATGRLMSPEQVDAVLSSHREFQSIDSVLRRSPRAVQTLMEEQARLERGEGADGQAGADDTPAPFDEKNWPFETETPQGKALLDIARSNHAMATELKQLKTGLGGVRGTLEQQTVAQLEGTWKQAAFKAADELPGEYRPMFIRSVRREFNLLRAQGRLTKANAQKVIDGELAEVRAASKGKVRQTVNRQSETVAANAGLPRTPRPGTVVPATGKDTSKTRETMKDASKGFLSKYR